MLVDRRTVSLIEILNWRTTGFEPFATEPDHIESWGNARRASFPPRCGGADPLYRPAISTDSGGVAFAEAIRRRIARPWLDGDLMVKRPIGSWSEIRHAWKTLASYERFEMVVGLLLRGVIGVIIVVALYRLIAGVVGSILLRALNPLDHVVFQQVFGAIMTLLIALEFNHTLRYAAPGARGIIHARIVILIALLALARKIIVADLFEIAPAALFGLAALSLSLGLTYWLIRDKDAGRRERKDEPAPSRAGPV